MSWWSSQHSLYIFSVNNAIWIHGRLKSTMAGYKWSHWNCVSNPTSGSSTLIVEIIQTAVAMICTPIHWAIRWKLIIYYDLLQICWHRPGHRSGNLCALIKELVQTGAAPVCWCRLDRKGGSLSASRRWIIVLMYLDDNDLVVSAMNMEQKYLKGG